MPRDDQTEVTEDEREALNASSASAPSSLATLARLLGIAAAMDLLQFPERSASHDEDDAA